MNIQQLEYIVTLYQQGSFAKAAEKCFVTQPTLSMMIQKLESELNAPIFDRSKYPVVPTEQGLQIIRQAQKILNEIRQLREIVTDNIKHLKGTLTIGVIPTISPYLVPIFALSFMKQFPDIKIKIQEITTDEIIEKVKKGMIDAGILATPLGEEDLLEKKLFNEKFFLYTSDKKLQNKKEVTLKEIKQQDVWLLTEGHCLRNQVLDICKPSSGHSLEFMVGNLDTLIKLIDHHGGSTIIPELALQYLTKEQMKKVKSIAQPVPSREVSIVQNKLYLKENLINALYDHIIQCLKEVLTENVNIKTKVIAPLLKV